MSVVIAFVTTAPPQGRCPTSSDLPGRARLPIGCICRRRLACHGGDGHGPRSISSRRPGRRRTTSFDERTRQARGRHAGRVACRTGAARPVGVRRGVRRLPGRPLRLATHRYGVTPVILDTDVASALLKGAATRSARSRLSGQPLAITFVTVGELTQWTFIRRRGPTTQSWTRPVLRQRRRPALQPAVTIFVVECLLERTTVDRRASETRTATRRP
jgi:hypothetical protein